MTNPKFLAAQQAKAAAKEESKGGEIKQVQAPVNTPATTTEEVKQPEVKPAK